MASKCSVLQSKLSGILLISGAAPPTHRVSLPLLLSVFLRAGHGNNRICTCRAYQLADPKIKFPHDLLNSANLLES